MGPRVRNVACFHTEKTSSEWQVAAYIKMLTVCYIERIVFHSILDPIEKAKIAKRYNIYLKFYINILIKFYTEAVEKRIFLLKSRYRTSTKSESTVFLWDFQFISNMEALKFLSQIKIDYFNEYTILFWDLS